MKRTQTQITALLLSTVCLPAYPSVPVPTTPVPGVKVSEVRLERDGRYLTVGMEMDLSGLKVSGNRAVLLTPRLINGKDTLDLPSVGIYGRQRYYYYMRNGSGMLTGSGERSYRSSDKPAALQYEKVVGYQDWMDGASLTLLRRDYGCCSRLLAQRQGDELGRHDESPAAFFPELVYVRPQGESEKSRSLEGSAYIDFPVNRTEIYPDYRRNTAELGRIQGTIDSVRGDRDITITRVWLKGYASPESPYAHNKELAIGRTQSLRNHIQQLYRFGDGIIETDYEAEDWAGLRRYIEGSNLSHKAEILGIIAGTADPDEREKKIKASYPEEYRFLLQNCYPSLRHTDYRISYTVRSYSDVEEIRRIMATQPQKLSLNEFYLLSEQYEPGSDGFTEVFETAVRMYPDDAAANLNAANAAMRRGDNAAAGRYLEKAGNSPEAVYARGALAIRQGDYATARRYMEEASSLGVGQAKAVLPVLEKRAERK